MLCEDVNMGEVYEVKFWSFFCQYLICVIGRLLWKCNAVRCQEQCLSPVVMAAPVSAAAVMSGHLKN